MIADSKNSLIVTKSISAVLRVLEVNNECAKIVIKQAREVHERYGDGCATFILRTEAAFDCLRSMLFLDYSQGSAENLVLREMKNNNGNSISSFSALNLNLKQVKDSARVTRVCRMLLRMRERISQYLNQVPNQV